SRWAFRSIVGEISLALATRSQANTVVPEGARHRQSDAMCLLGVRQSCLPGTSPWLDAGGHERVKSLRGPPHAFVLPASI
ncbi:MAG: hypothetical protein VXZ63_12515, partial [Planctomycetota bacterium]|nr:hypothetical protein [Planctomycetota bacterium]